MAKVLVILEGYSDYLFYRRILPSMFNCPVYCYITNTDVTCKYKNSNILQCMIDDNGINEEDFDLIAIITDTDACFIPENYIVEGTKGKYYKNAITTTNRNSIITRNRRKSENIINTINHSGEIYYNSINLEHVLGLTPNRKSRKTNSAARIAETMNTVQDMCNFFFGKLLVSCNFNRTWEYIENGIHSLEPRTNVGLMFLRHIELVNPEVLSYLIYKGLLHH